MPQPRTFLGIVRQKNRRLFYGFVAFAGITLLMNASKNEITPFFVWSMYGRPMPVRDTFVIYALKYDGKDFKAPHTWLDHRRMMFFYTIDQYCVIRDNGGTDPSQEKAGKWLGRIGASSLTHKLYPSPDNMAQYPAWLKRYMQQATGEHIETMEVYRNWMEFDDKGKASLHRSELLFKI